MRDLQNNIDAASEHIIWMKNVIADWRVIVADLQRAGCRIACAENALDSFISTLKTLELYESFSLEEIKKQDGPRHEIIAA
jgi:hypothetical protein